MKFTNSYLPRVALVLGVAGAVTYNTACSDDFLEVEPTGVLTSDLLGSADGVERLLIGAYSILDGNGGFYSGSSNWIHGSVRGGDQLKGSTPGDQPAANPVQRYEVLANNAVIAEKWRTSFEGVTRANLALRTVLDSEDPSVAENEAFRNSAIGQALFLRSHYYFELAKNFNRVPYITEDIAFDEIANVTNGPILEEIDADLTRAVELLPEAQDAVGKANKWAAQAYLGKVKLYLGKYAEAQALLEDVIENGTNPNGLKFALLDNYADAFNGDFDNAAESVFAIQASVGAGNINTANPDLVLNYPNGGPQTGCCGFAQPSHDLVFSFRTDDDGLPLLDKSYRDEENRIASDADLTGEEPFTEDEDPIDPRLDHTVGRRGIPYLDWGDHPGRAWVRDVTNGGPFAYKKSVFRSSQNGVLTDGSSWTPGYTAVNYNIIRYADVILMAAEAHIENNDELDRATELINMVRMRALTRIRSLRTQMVAMPPTTSSEPTMTASANPNFASAYASSVSWSSQARVTASSTWCAGG